MTLEQPLTVSFFVDCLETVADEEGKVSADTVGAVRTGIQVGLAIGEARPSLAAAVLREIERRALDGAIGPGVTAMVDQLVAQIEVPE